MKYWVKVGENAQGPLDPRELIAFPNLASDSLISLDSDPDENTNLVTDTHHRQTLDDMRARLARAETKAKAARR